jgi:multimeric flavodoxin WrbA
MQKVFPKLCRADRILVSSPIFFGTVTAQLKALIDRCQALWVRKYILKQGTPAGPDGRYGAFLSAGGRRTEEYFRVAETTIRIFFLTLDVKYVTGLFFSGVDDKGEIERHPTARTQAFALGAQLASGQWSVAGEGS